MALIVTLVTHGFGPGYVTTFLILGYWWILMVSAWLLCSFGPYVLALWFVWFYGSHVNRLLGYKVTLVTGSIILWALCYGYFGRWLLWFCTCYNGSLGELYNSGAYKAKH